MSKTISEQIEEIINDICKDYCKYPSKYVGFEDDYFGYQQMIEEKCDKCPLNKL